MTMTKELWEQSPNYFVKGGGRCKKRQVTKGRLVEEFRKKEGIMCPVIATEVREGADDMTEGVPYEITDVEEVTTDVQSLSGIRVTLLSVKAEEGNVMLWQRKVTGVRSKLGAFITALGSDTDKWLHKWVVLEPWQLRNNVVTVVPAPAPKAPKRSKPKG